MALEKECSHLAELRFYLHYNQLVIHAGYETPDDDGSVIFECKKCDTIRCVVLHDPSDKGLIVT